MSELQKPPEDPWVLHTRHLWRCEMMAGVEKPTPVEFATWPRAELFRHYSETAPCTYAITVEVDVTALTEELRRAGRRAYPAHVWALASVVNRHEEFRMTLADGHPAIWPVLHPSFTVFNPAHETFSVLWTPFDSDFARFHAHTTEVMDRHRDSRSFLPQGDPPPNCFDVSSVPWTGFTAFNLMIDGGSRHLLPIFTLGRYIRRGGGTLLPLAVQVHHAAADGFHTARLINEVRDLVGKPDWVA
jgi:chloramphenicol O-acetyltransferase type A